MKQIYIIEWIYIQNNLIGKNVGNCWWNNWWKAIQEKAEDILDTFDIEGGATVETVWEMAKYVVAFEKWVKDEN